MTKKMRWVILRHGRRGKRSQVRGADATSVLLRRWLLTAEKMELEALTERTDNPTPLLRDGMLAYIG